MFIKYKVEGLFLFFWKEKKGREILNKKKKNEDRLGKEMKRRAIFMNIAFFNKPISESII